MGTTNQWVPQLLNVDSNRDYAPCPFKGGWYQWMRNLVACAAMTEPTGKRGMFAVVYADGPFPMARKVGSPEWREFTRCAEGRSVPVATVSYQKLVRWALAAASEDDVALLERLEKWVERKIDSVAGASSGPPPS